ncbi:MAG: CotH kinase family protein [Anaerolineales bacterium]|nr:CotH kinase family protein [Anaerolineales bacterium]
MKLTGLKEAPYRKIEKGLIMASLLAFGSLLFLVPESIPLPATETEGLSAIASAMPNSGWAPLTVYFSAVGSISDSEEITKYEWDLDGNGVMDTDATRNNGYAQYNYQKPGEYTVTLQITDSSGNVARDSIPVSARHPGSSSVDYWSVFDDSRIRKVEIRLTQENWDLMWEDIEAKIEVPADAVVFGETLENIGFRMRGQFSMRESGWKKPWKINTDAYIADQEYHNLRQLMFINSIGDPSMLAEKLSYDLMRFAGLPASHVTFVEFWIDITDDQAPSQFWGVYTMIERVDRKFLSSRFTTDARDGNLYKASHAQRGPMDLVYYGDNIDLYPHINGLVAYGKENNEEEGDYSDIIELCRIIDGNEYDSPEAFAEALEGVFNVDSYLRYMAVIALTMNWDSYPYTGNNFYLFNNPVSGRFEWIPWDLTWGGDSRMPLFERGEFLISPYAPLFDNVFSVERYRRQYAAYLDLLMRYAFNYETINTTAQAYHDMIDPYLHQQSGDKMYYGDTAWFTPYDFESAWQEMGVQADLRNRYVQSFLIQEGYLKPDPED